MEKIIKLLNKYNDISIKKEEILTSVINNQNEILKDTNVVLKYNNEIDYFHNYLILKCIKLKKELEIMSLNTYVLSGDYWNQITYCERVAIVNIDNKKILEDMPYLVSNEKNIYLPIFKEDISCLITHEILLMDLKKYRYLKEEFNNEISLDHYNNEIYKYNLMPLKYICELEDKCIVYYKALNKFYLLKNHKYISHIALDKDIQLNNDNINIIANYYIDTNVLELSKYLVDNSLVNDKINKKLNKVISKLEK